VLHQKELVRVKVFYHDRCFDGASSAALFSAFTLSGPQQLRIRFWLLHRAGSLFNEADFDGDENAIVDFSIPARRRSPVV
jgi:hypothetical protein